MDHPRFAEGALQECLMKELQRWPFRPYEGQQATVGLSFTIGKGSRLMPRAPVAERGCLPRGGAALGAGLQGLLDGPGPRAHAACGTRDCGSWGFPSFEAYCTRELRIRKATALKLTRSWSFLDRHERHSKPEAPDARPAPAFEVVEVLAEAEERGALDAEEYRSIRDSIWGSDRPVAAVRRELSERFPRPAPEPAPTEVRLGQLARTARRLAEDLRVCRGVPTSVRTQADDLAAAVESLAVERVAN